MRSVDAVVTELLHGLHPGAERGITRISEGVYEIDHGDDDQVVLLVATAVPRRRLGPAAPLVVGAVEGVDVRLIDVVVDTRLRLYLEFASAGPPPEALMHLGLVVTDDRGTTYRFGGGQAGPGPHAVLTFGPAPPPEATRVVALTPDGPVTSLEL